MPDLPKAALWYARHGWHVFPLRPRTKEPFAGLGVYNATDDVNQVIDWWRRWPQANIGLHCGGSGLLALDLDEYKDNYEGQGLLSRDDEETLTSITGGSGTHLIYATPGGSRYGNAKGTLPYGIDVRGWGGYIVLPPSIHPNGRRYQWEIGYSPDALAPRPLPSSLLSILSSAVIRPRNCGEPSSASVATGIAGVERLIAALGLEVHPPIEYDNGGRKWILKHCPFQPTDAPHAQDRGAYILVAKDGHAAAGCQHARCQHRLHTLRQTGWTYLWNMVYGRVAA